MSQLTQLRLQFVNLAKQRDCKELTDYADLLEFLAAPLLDRIRSLQEMEDKRIEDRKNAIQASVNWEQLATRRKGECEALQEEQAKLFEVVQQKEEEVERLSGVVLRLEHQLKEERFNAVHLAGIAADHKKTLDDNEVQLTRLKESIGQLRSTIRVLCGLVGGV